MKTNEILKRIPAVLALVLVQTLPLSTTAFAGDIAEDELVRVVEKAYELGPRAAYVFDLDETIVDSSPRRFYSVLEAMERICQMEFDPAADPFPPRADDDPRPQDPSESIHEDCGVYPSLDLGDLYRLPNRYDIPTYLRHAGMNDPEFIEAVAEESFAIYLSGAYIVEEDRLYAGAQAFIRELRNAGAEVYFVSARTASTQLRPTLEFLRRRGLISESDHVYLKESSESSMEFKRRAVLDIAARTAEIGGRVDAIFENEPENLSIWAEVFPRAKAFFVEGAYLKSGPIPFRSIRIGDYRY